MEITLLIKSIMGLIAILALLMFLFFYSSASKKNKKIDTKTPKKTIKPREAVPDLQTLRMIIKNKKTKTKELKKSLDLVLKYYGNIHKKLGVRVHPDFDVYMEILFTICRHPHTNKNIIVDFDKELGRLNPDYKAEINDAITKGLNSRGA